MAKDLTLYPSKIVHVQRRYSATRVYYQDTYMSTRTSYTNGGSNYQSASEAKAGSNGTTTSTTYLPYGEKHVTTTCTQNRLLLSFDLSNVSGIIKAAKLRLYPTSSNNNGITSLFTIGRITEYWDESTVTWVNQPAHTSTGNSSSQLPCQSWTEVDVLDLIAADTNGYGLKILCDSTFNTARTFDKSEGYLPQLILTVEGSYAVHVKANGSWKDGTAFVKVGGSWKEGTVYVKANGAWKEGI